MGNNYEMDVLSADLESLIPTDQLNEYLKIAKHNEIRQIVSKQDSFPPKTNSGIMKFQRYLKAVHYTRFNTSANYLDRIERVEQLTESINNVRILTFFGGFFAVFFANFGYYRFTKNVRAGSALFELGKFFFLSFGFGGLVCEPGARYLRPQFYSERTQILNDMRHDLSFDPILASFYQKTIELFK